MATCRRRHTVLVVDDDQGLLDVLDEVLTDEGFTTSCHPLGQTAMQALAQQRFDVIVTDVTLPDMNGLEICVAARERYGDSAAILVVSGIDIRRRTATSLQLGADDFVPKPFDLDEFLARIDAKVRRLPAA